MEAGRSPNIEILTNSRLLSLEGEPGNFTAKVYQEPRYIDEDKCTACGTCKMYCPKPVVDEYNERLDITRAPHIDYAQAIPSSYYIDPRYCLRVNFETCNLCAQTCTAGAIDFSQKPKELALEVGAVVMAPGFGKVDNSVLQKFGYGKYLDVVTNLEFERLTCASGPTEGHIIRLSDNKKPKNIAFLQCIGSRDETCGNGYCSSICCMSAIKEASVAKEHEPEVDVSIFFMDVRTQGKGFDDTRQRAEEKYGINVIKARVPRVEQISGKLALNYVTEDGKSHSDIFDMVVLSVGLESPEGAKEMAKISGIELNHYDFCKTITSKPLSTSREGVLVAGAFSGPKDVPESVTQASGVAAEVSEILSSARGTKSVHLAYPDEDKTLSEEKPRIGVFVCHCGVNIAGVVDVKAVRDYAATLSDVVYYENVMYSCSQDALKMLAQKIKDNRLNRVVIAACSPRTHEPLFQETMKSVGVNPAFFEMANIRDQCSWVHAKEPDAATQKSKDLVRMAVAKARELEPLQAQTVDVLSKALVIGGGVAGMTSALSIAEQGFECALIERTDKLGGNAGRLKLTNFGEDAGKILSDLMKKVSKHPKITVKLNTELDELSGFVGNFISKLNSAGNSEIFEHGVVVIATGGYEYQPSQYYYGESNKVLTQLQLEEKISKGKTALKNINNIVMIQCVGSRGDDLKYCSKFCCAQAVKNALAIKKINPDANIYILYRDIRTYGFNEDLYKEARNQGVIFISYNIERKPEAIKDGENIRVRVFDALIGEDIEIPADILALSVGVAPADNLKLSNIIKAPLTGDGFFLEAHAKLKPVEVAVDGVYLAGHAHGPKTLDESIAQAKAAAGKACIPLAKGKVSVAPIVSKVDKDACIGCGLCESLCPYKAIQLIKIDKKKKAETITASCKGCGICASHCPTLAISMGGFTDEAIMSQIHAFAESINKENV